MDGPKQPTFERLNSILCEYKMGRVTPSKNGPLTYEVCADLCQEELQNANRWSHELKKKYHPMIRSALRLVCKDKKEEWFA